METNILKPEKALRTFWLICWWIWFVLGSLTFLMLMIAQPIVFGVILMFWVLIMLPVLLWMFFYYAALEYAIDDDSIKGNSGVFWKKYVTIPFTKVTNLDITQGPVQRIFGIGTIHVQTAGAGGQQGEKAELKMLGIKDLQEVKDNIMAKIRAHTITATDQPRPKAETQADSQVLERMLNELVAIRKVLEEKKSNSLPPMAP
jgi:uncharacterized membrane protein YdbT with pleckstrin-like domain